MGDHDMRSRAEIGDRLMGPEIFLRWVTMTTIGGLTVGVGWGLARSEEALANQVSPMNLAMLGLLLAAGAHASAIRRMRATLWSRREGIIELLVEVGLLPVSAGGSRAEADALDTVSDDQAPVRSSDHAYVSLPGGRFIHRPSCSLVRGKHELVEHRDRAASDALAPCGVCQP